MAKFSSGLRNGMLAATGFSAALSGNSELRIFAGASAPASADDAETGTLLMTLSANGAGVGLSFGAPADGAVSKTPAETWMTTSTDAAGTCKYFRLVDTADVGDLSATAPRVQGSIGLVGADMNLTDAVVAAGVPWTLNYFAVGLPTLE